MQGAMFQHAMWGYDLFAPLSLPHVLDGLFTFAALEFLSTGLFITTRKYAPSVGKALPTLPACGSQPVQGARCP